MSNGFWNPGQTDSALERLLEQQLEEGQYPHFVDQFFAKGEVDSANDTLRIRRAMSRYLRDRGVVLDEDGFLDGDFDEYMALAYDHAMRSARGEVDPINNTRGGATDGELWDFTVDTFDDIERQGVVPINIRAAGAIDYVYELGDRLGIFRLQDSLLLNWASGSIDVVDGEAANQLYRVWKLRDERSSPEERAMLYKRVLNKGDAKVLDRMVVNEPHTKLWSMLMEEVADYIDKSEKLEAGRTEDSPVSRRGIFLATQELQYNLTEYCTGMAHMQARELYAQLQEAISILRNPEILAHFGGSRRKTLWSVIETLAKEEFGHAPNIPASRSLAVDGNRIYRWIEQFQEGSVRDEDFADFIDAAESYVLNASMVADAPGAGEDDFGDDEFEDEFDDGENDAEFEDDF